MTDRDKTTIDPLEGAIGGITGRDGKYPLKDRRRDQGYDVDTEPAVVYEGAPSDAHRDLTDPPGQPITSPSEPYPRRAEDERITSTYTEQTDAKAKEDEKDDLTDPPGQPVADPPHDERDLSTLPEEYKTTQPAPEQEEGSEEENRPWESMNSHSQLDKYAEENDIFLPEVWGTLTIAKKKEWLSDA